MRPMRLPWRLFWRVESPIRASRRPSPKHYSAFRFASHVRYPKCWRLTGSRALWHGRSLKWAETRYHARKKQPKWRCSRNKYMALLQNIWWYLVLIGVMILVHELGHFFAARFFDVKVETFSFGFGPRLFGFKKGETDFRFAAIFFGGYVKMAGDQPGDENANDPRGFLSKPRWQRLIIAFAGPAMNIILAVAILTGLFMVRYPKLPSTPSPVIGFVVPDGAAAKAGVREGDRVVQIGGTANPTWEDIQMKEVASAGHELPV